MENHLLPFTKSNSSNYFKIPIYFPFFLIKASQENLKTEDDLKTEHNLKIGDDLKNEDDHKNEDNLYFEDCTRPELTQP